MTESTSIADPATYDRAVAHFSQRRIALPTFAELAEPQRIGSLRREQLAAVDPDAADARNLFRVHWYNDAARSGLAALPAHVVLPESLTGVASPIVVVLGDRFPMIHAHKVLPAYACLVSRLVTGRFDPTHQRALWPSTGNYCRGGVAISRTLLSVPGVRMMSPGSVTQRSSHAKRSSLMPAGRIATPWQPTTREMATPPRQ